ncbi:MAG TPA: MEDS domain-containing protein [Candidatus Nitrosocosmicus sp.]|nr:MEDS domain-containing protein [Candidatus Nitrosocosmicus sp.]
MSNSTNQAILLMYSKPYSFIEESSDDPRHIVLFYDDVKEGQKIQFKFILSGLLKGENCIYVTRPENIVSTENEMRGYGINVDNYCSKRQLHLQGISNLFGRHTEVLATAEDFVKKIIERTKTTI